MALQLQGQLQEARVASQVLQRQLEEEQEGRARVLEETAYAQESAASVEAALRAELETAQARQIVCGSSGWLGCCPYCLFGCQVELAAAHLASAQEFATSREVPCEMGWTLGWQAGMPEPCWIEWVWWQRSCHHSQGWTAVLASWLHHAMAGAAKGCQGIEAAGAAGPAQPRA